MNPKIASSFTIVLALAMMLFTSPVMIMSPSIFASPSDDGGGGSSDDGGSSDGGDGSSENEQPEVESEPEVTEEEEETEPELVNCPDGSQAATTEECPTGAAPTAPTGLVNCLDGSQAATTDECPTGAAPTSPTEFPNVLWGDYFYTDPCKTNPSDPLCKAPIASGTNTPGAPSGSIPADTGAVKNDICKTSSDAPFCKTSTTSGTTTTTGAPTGTTTTGAPAGTTTTGALTKPKVTEVPKNADGSCPSGAHTNPLGGIPGCVIVDSSTPTPTLTPTTTPAPKLGDPVPKNADGSCPSGSSSVGSAGNAGQPGTGTSLCILTSTPTPTPTTTPAPKLGDPVPKNADGSCPSGSSSVGSAGNAGQPGTGTSLCILTSTPTPTPTTTPAPIAGEVPKNADGTCPAGSSEVGFGGKTGSNAPSGSKCISDNAPAKTTTTPKPVEVPFNPDGTCPPGYTSFTPNYDELGPPPSSTCLSDNAPAKTTTTPAQTTTPPTGTTTTPPTGTTTTPPTGTTTTPPTGTTTKTVIVTKTNINNDQVTVRNDGGLTVQTLDGAVTPTADCPPQSATVVLGPSPMENGKARILAAFDPCILTSGKVLLHLPDEKGIQLVGAKIQDGQTTQSAIIPIQRIAPTAPGQAQYFIDLSEQSTGLDLVSGNPVNLSGGNVNALLLMNLGGENVQLGADNNIRMDAALTKAAITATATATQPPTLASNPAAVVGGS